MRKPINDGVTPPLEMKFKIQDICGFSSYMHNNVLLNGAIGESAKVQTSFFSKIRLQPDNIFYHKPYCKYQRKLWFYWMVFNILAQSLILLPNCVQFGFIDLHCAVQRARMTDQKLWPREHSLRKFDLIICKHIDWSIEKAMTTLCISMVFQLETLGTEVVFVEVCIVNITTGNNNDVSKLQRCRKQVSIMRMALAYPIPKKT